MEKIVPAMKSNPKNSAMRPLRAGILVPRLEAHDAIGTDTLRIYSVLTEAGYDTTVFTNGSSVKKDVKLKSYDRIADYLHLSTDILIYQYAIAWPEVLPILRKAECRKILRFHNVTPPEFFTPYHKGIANACRAGLEQIPDYLSCGWNGILADSEYNKSVLIRYGADENSVTIVPPFHRISELITLKPSIDFIKKYVSGRTLIHSAAEKFTRRISFLRKLTFIRWLLRSGYQTHNTLLMVGRLVPGKGYEDLINIFNNYRQKYDPDSRLLIAGKKTKGLESYYRRLNLLIKQYNLQDCIDFTGELSDSQLKSAYLSSRVLVMASHHEGFCIPVLEAMAIGLPVIARSDTALTGTVGEGGILITPPEKTGSAESDQENLNAYYRDFAEAVYRMVSDEKAAMNQIRTGCRYYYEKFSDEEIRKLFMKAINRIEIQSFTESSVAD